MRLRRRKHSNGESAKAVREAEQHVEDAKARNPEVYQIAGEIKRLRERNHFAEDLYVIMGGRRPEGRPR